mmetsp:Transcript_97010/g.278768  ORF Transcript_97010/g.278768 Transcript_97010/m.278768 type:complete len:317 (-) Transcript_97010:550-1500(-)
MPSTLLHTSASRVGFTGRKANGASTPQIVKHVFMLETASPAAARGPKSAQCLRIIIRGAAPAEGTRQTYRTNSRSATRRRTARRHHPCLSPVGAHRGRLPLWLASPRAAMTPCSGDFGPATSRNPAVIQAADAVKARRVHETVFRRVAGQIRRSRLRPRSSLPLDELLLWQNEHQEQVPLAAIPIGIRICMGLRRGSRDVAAAAVAAATAMPVVAADALRLDGLGCRKAARQVPSAPDAREFAAVEADQIQEPIFRGIVLQRHHPQRLDILRGKAVEEHGLGHALSDFGLLGGIQQRGGHSRHPARRRATPHAAQG